jgi:hypothetical protein
MTLKPLVCPNCGGSIHRDTMICEYCGTKFELDNSHQVLRVETYTSPVRTFQAQVMIPNEEFKHNNAEALTDYTISKLRSNLMDALTDMMELRTVYDPRLNHQIITARMRVVDPNYRF